MRKRVTVFIGFILFAVFVPAPSSATFIDYSAKEINAKVVYYGPPSVGLEENLGQIYKRIKPKFKGKMNALASESDRVVFFDFIPSTVRVRGFGLRLHLYTIPGQVTYQASRKLILKGVDAVVFVADADRQMLQATLDNWKSLQTNLESQGYEWKSVPLVIQLDRRGKAPAMPPREMRTLLGLSSEPLIDADSSQGAGVFETVNEVTRIIRNALETATK